LCSTEMKEKNTELFVRIAYDGSQLGLGDVAQW
jgi:hypothetical protein